MTRLFVLSLLFTIYTTVASAQCNVTLDSMTIRVTQVSTIDNSAGQYQYYLLCPGVTLTYDGAHNTEVTYYLEDSARVISEATHTAILYMKPFSSINANFHLLGQWAQTDDVWHHPTATFENNVGGQSYNQCIQVVFNYENVSGCGLVSLNELNQRTPLRIYPNPASDFIEIETEEEFKKTIAIFNVVGKKVKQIKSNTSTTKITVSDLNAGTYFVKVIDGYGNEATHKLIIRN